MVERVRPKRRRTWEWYAAVGAASLAPILALLAYLRGGASDAFRMGAILQSLLLGGVLGYALGAAYGKFIAEPREKAKK